MSEATTNRAKVMRRMVPSQPIFGEPKPKFYRKVTHLQYFSECARPCLKQNREWFCFKQKRECGAVGHQRPLRDV